MSTFNGLMIYFAIGALTASIDVGTILDDTQKSKHLEEMRALFSQHPVYIWAPCLLIVHLVMWPLFVLSSLKKKLTGDWS